MQKIARGSVTRFAFDYHDPVVLEAPLVYTLAYRRQPDYKMVEFVCENNREYIDENGRVRMRLRDK